MWVSVFDVFWILFGVVVLSGVFWPQVSIVCVCVLDLIAMTEAELRNESGQ